MATTREWGSMNGNAIRIERETGLSRPAGLRVYHGGQLRLRLTAGWFFFGKLPLRFFYRGIRLGFVFNFARGAGYIGGFSVFACIGARKAGNYHAHSAFQAGITRTSSRVPLFGEY